MLKRIVCVVSFSVAVFLMSGKTYSSDLLTAIDSTTASETSRIETMTEVDGHNAETAPESGIAIVAHNPAVIQGNRGSLYTYFDAHFHEHEARLRSYDIDGFDFWKADGERFMTPDFINSCIERGGFALLNDGRPELAHWFCYTMKRGIVSTWSCDTIEVAQSFIKSAIKKYQKRKHQYRKGSNEWNLLFECVGNLQLIDSDLRTAFITVQM